VAVVNVADKLLLQEGFDYAGVAAAQTTCPEVVDLRAKPSLHVEPVICGAHVLLCDMSTGRPRPLIPPAFRQQLFQLVHGLAHPSIRATRRLLAARAVWKGLSADVSAWCRDCQACQRAKVTKQPRAPLQPIDVPVHRFTHVHVDIVGPLPVSSTGFSHVFTMIDRSTRWVEVVPLTSTTTSACVDALITCWVARFGVPSLLTSDRGVQFCSAMWTTLCTRLGISHVMTTAYHPQANGMVERFHRQLKDTLRARLAGAAWPDHLPWVLLGLRAAP
jgi:transposase InsO family protein